MPTEKASPPNVPKLAKAIILLLLIGSSAQQQLFPAVAAELKTEYGRWVHRSWTTENGLPQNTVYALAQTQDGFLWVGCEGGLARFDGLDFVIFNRSNTLAMMKNSVTSLCPDRDGSLWIGTFGGGLLNFRAGKFIRIEGLGSDLIWSLRLDDTGSLWVVTADKGIYCLEKGESPALVVAGDIPAQEITAMSKDDRGAIWIGTRKGLILIQNGTKKLYSIRNGLAGDYIYCLFADNRDNMWVGTTTGLSRINEQGIRNFAAADGLADDLVRTVSADHLGRLWIGTEKGVTIMEPGDTAVCFTPDILAGDSVMAICRDREDNMWVGTSAGGLNFLKKNEATIYSTDDGLSGQQIQPICADRQDRLWVGTRDRGLNVFSDGHWRSYAFRDGLRSNAITSLLADSRGRLWIGTRESGLQCLDNGEFSDFGKEGGLGNEAILSLFMDRENNFWIGSDGGGLERFRDGSWRHYGLASGLKSQTILAINQDRQGNLWAGSLRDGLHVLRKGAWQQYTMADGLAGDTVYSIHIDERDDVWLGTNGGLNRLHDGKFSNYREWPGPLTGTILQILADDQGYLWFSSPACIFRVRKSELGLPGSETGEDIYCRQFTEMSGLKSAVCSGGFQPAGCKSRDGRLWFPTQKGLAMIDPKNLDSRKPPLQARVEKIVANGLSMALADATRFPAGTKRFDFFYTAACFADPRQVEFSTRLDGYEGSWSKPERLRSRHFADLPAGGYAFRVRARGQDGIWNESGMRLVFRIEPYFHQTVWFYLMVLLVAAAVSASAVAYRRRKARLQKLDRYKLSTLGAGKAQEYLLQLKKAMEKDKAYLDPDLTLAKLAAAAAIPAKHLSQIINEQYQLNFNDFINRYRVDEARRRLLDPAAKDFKLLRIAFEAGFNSKSVFNSAFKKITGLRPSEFRLLLRDDGAGGRPEK